MTQAFFSRAVAFLLLALPIVAAAHPATVADLVLEGRMHHLRSAPEREWAEFPDRAEGPELVVAFDAKRNATGKTIRLRHRDVKQVWRMLLNGKEIARLPPDEADMITYWAVPPGTLQDGRNELRVHGAGNASDDVMIGEMTLIDRPRDEVLSEATLEVTVVEEPGGRAIPCRITVTNEDRTRIAIGSPSGERQAVRPGVVYCQSGFVRLQLPAGRYVIYAGRGFEYSLASAAVTLTAGATASRRLSIRREVDTAGWAAMDTHVHTGTYAGHGDAAVDERMLTIAGEGIELPVSTEHNTRVDYDAHARNAGVREHFTPVLGSEVTTPALGHFNVFPMPTGGMPIDQRSPTWTELGRAIRGVAMNPVIVLNHGRDTHGGFRPLDPGRHISIAGEDLDGWPLPANAMEVINSGAVMTDGLALPRDWMAMLNRGVILTPVGSSDSHDVTRYIVGQGRTYVRCDDRDAGAIDLANVAESVRRGRVMVSYGLVTEIDAAGRGPGELVDAAKEIDVRIRVKGPGWTRAERVALYVNGVKLREHEIANGTRAGIKWEGTWRLEKPAHDVHLVAVATGPGIGGPYWPTAKPYQPTSTEFTPYVLGLSGAVFVDADGSGTFESAYEYARREVLAASDARGLAARLGSYDSAVAIQAASLLRVRQPDVFEQYVRSMVETARPLVSSGLMAYMEAWKESRAVRARAVPPGF